MPDDSHPDEPDVTGAQGDGGADRGADDGDATQAVPIGGADDETPPEGSSAVTRAMAAAAPPAAVSGAAPGTGAAAPGVARTARSRGASANRTWIAVLVVVALLVVGAGIALAVSGGKKSATPPTSPTGATDIPASTAPAGPACPLTGAPSEGQVPPRPALAVKVDNYPQARPQSGLNEADIVYEEPVEGGITRLVAVFQCQSPALIGPIRSARAVDVPILDQLSRPVFLHAGGIDPVLALLQEGNLIDDNVFDHASVIQMPAGRSAPYDTYVSAAAAWGLDPKDTTSPAPVFTYSTTAPAGTAVATLHIPFSGTNNTLWTWDASSGRWLLSYQGTPATVQGGGQISTTNIVVQTVQVTYGPWLENNVGGYEVQSKMTGSGPLVVLRNGVAVSGTWSRESLSDVTTLTGVGRVSHQRSQPGPTWVEIVPAAVHVTTTPGSSGAPRANSPVVDAHAGRIPGMRRGPGRASGRTAPRRPGPSIPVRGMCAVSP